jgi:hypothetical protein
MEQGSLRCDANVSLRPSPDAPFGTRTETKNVNSLRSVERAVRYEITRQAAVLSAGGTIVQETPGAAPPPAAGRVGLQRPRDARPGERPRRRAGRGDGRGRCLAGCGAQVVDR